MKQKNYYFKVKKGSHYIRTAAAIQKELKKRGMCCLASEIEAMLWRDRTAYENKADGVWFTLRPETDEFTGVEYVRVTAQKTWEA